MLRLIALVLSTIERIYIFSKLVSLFVGHMTCFPLPHSLDTLYRAIDYRTVSVFLFNSIEESSSGLFAPTQEKRIERCLRF